MTPAILFDLDGTLLDRDTSVDQFIATQYDRLSAHWPHISKNNYTRRFIELDCRGHVWKDQVYQQLVAELAITSISWQNLLADYEIQFQRHCVPFPFLMEMLHDVQRQGYLIGMITNGLGEFQNRSIDGLGIRDYFNVILISEVEQVRKPQPEIFQRAADRLGVSAADCVFIGDHPEADIGGAQNAQMKAIWKRNSHWSAPSAADASIDQLSEIPLVLEQFKNS